MAANYHQWTGSVLIIMYVTMATLTSGLPTNNPLLLSPFLESNNIQGALNASMVQNDVIPKSYSGFLTVNKNLGNHLFFWFFPSQENANAPLLLWLNGGPGVSSMSGVFFSHGPIQFSKTDGTASYERRNQFSWVGPFSMLYVDQPVGVGFSYSDSGEEGYRQTREEYTDDMYEFLQQFFVMFPEYRSREFYIGGQSYAGRYIPNLGHRMHKESRGGDYKLPLTGIYLGAPYYDPKTMAAPTFDYLYSFGVLSHAEKEKYKQDVLGMIDRYQQNPDKFMEKENMESIVSGYLLPRVPILTYYNLVTGSELYYYGLYELLNKPEMRRMLNAAGTGHEFRTFRVDTYKQFGRDILVSAKSKLSVLMDNYKVLIYNGDYDAVVSTNSLEAALLTTPWSRRDQYKLESRSLWNSTTSKEINGYYSRTGDFCRVVVHGAGHETPYDRPEVSLQMIKDFVSDGCVVGSK